MQKWTQSSANRIKLFIFTADISTMHITLHLGPPVVGLLFLSISILSIMSVVTVTFLIYPTKDDDRIFIRANSPDTPKKILENIIEYFLLLKTTRMGYRNSPSGNIRIIPTFWTTTFISAFLFCLFTALNKLEPAFIIGKKDQSLDETYLLIVTSFMALWLGLYWKEKKDLHEKWRYLAELYNQIISTPPGKVKSQFSGRESLRVALALDLLTMGMWGHTSFNSIFEAVLVEAYSHEHKVSHMEALGFLLENGIAFNDAEEYISRYQDLAVFNDKALYQPLTS